MAAARARALHPDVPGLAFRIGDAEALPLPDASFDVVVNIESSHCCGRIDRFVAEVARVLRPGGRFTWADMRSPGMLPDFERAFAHPDLEPVAAAELNAGVLAALDAMEAAKAREIARFAPLRPILREFAGMQGSMLRRALERRQALYLSRRFRRR